MPKEQKKMSQTLPSGGNIHTAQKPPNICSTIIIPALLAMETYSPEVEYATVNQVTTSILQLNHPKLHYEVDIALENPMFYPMKILHDRNVREIVSFLDQLDGRKIWKTLRSSFSSSPTMDIDSKRSSSSSSSSSYEISSVTSIKTIWESKRKDADVLTFNELKTIIKRVKNSKINSQDVFDFLWNRVKILANAPASVEKEEISFVFMSVLVGICHYDDCTKRIINTLICNIGDLEQTRQFKKLTNIALSLKNEFSFWLEQLESRIDAPTFNFLIFTLSRVETEFESVFISDLAIQHLKALPENKSSYKSLFHINWLVNHGSIYDFNFLYDPEKCVDHAYELFATKALIDRFKLELDPKLISSQHFLATSRDWLTLFEPFRTMAFYPDKDMPPLKILKESLLGKDFEFFRILIEMRQTFSFYNKKKKTYIGKIIQMAKELGQAVPSHKISNRAYLNEILKMAKEGHFLSLYFYACLVLAVNKIKFLKNIPDQFLKVFIKQSITIFLSRRLSKKLKNYCVEEAKEIVTASPCSAKETQLRAASLFEEKKREEKTSTTNAPANTLSSSSSSTLSTNLPSSSNISSLSSHRPLSSIVNSSSSSSSTLPTNLPSSSNISSLSSHRPLSSIVSSSSSSFSTLPANLPSSSNMPSPSSQPASRDNQQTVSLAVKLDEVDNNYCHKVLSRTQSQYSSRMWSPSPSFRENSNANTPPLVSRSKRCC